MGSSYYNNSGDIQDEKMKSEFEKIKNDQVKINICLIFSLLDVW